MARRSSYYKLVDKKPVPCTLREYAAQYSGDRDEERIVKKTELPDGSEVSTVFLGLDHNWTGSYPVLFETMVFGGEYHHYTERYRTYVGAEAGHERTVKMVLKGVKTKTDNNDEH
jgi:hypothetical protein